MCSVGSTLDKKVVIRLELMFSLKLNTLAGFLMVLPHTTKLKFKFLVSFEKVY